MKQKRFHGSGVDLSSLQSQIELVVVLCCLCCFELATAQKTWESRVQNFSDACEVWTECHQVPQANCNLHSFFPSSTHIAPTQFQVGLQHWLTAGVCWFAPFFRWFLTLALDPAGTNRMETSRWGAGSYWDHPKCMVLLRPKTMGLPSGYD